MNTVEVENLLQDVKEKNSAVSNCTHAGIKNHSHGPFGEQTTIFALYRKMRLLRLLLISSVKPT